MNPFLMRRRMFINKGNGIEKLEYIQNTGTQYIDAEYMPKTNTILNLDVQFIKNDNSKENIIEVMGVSQQDGECFAVNFNNNRLVFWLDKLSVNGGKYTAFYINEELYKRNVININAKGSVECFGMNQSTTPKTKNMEKALYLFGYNARSSVIKMNGMYNMKLFRCKIYEDDILIKDFIPAKSGEKVGLYDNISKKFHENKGNGDFLYA